MLTNLTDNQNETLEVIQNNAMRFMLGAPMWIKLYNLRVESNLPTLENRIIVRNTCIVSKAIQSERNTGTHTKNKVLNELPKHPNLQRPNTYTKQLVDCARSVKMDGVLAKLKTDAPNNNAVASPWESGSAKFIYTKLHRAKENCTIAELRAAATTAMKKSKLHSLLHRQYR